MSDDERKKMQAAMHGEDFDSCDRKIFNLNAEQWTTLQAALDAPPRILPRMKKLLTEPGYFDSGPEDTTARN
jgi:hypothetical protein